MAQIEIAAFQRQRKSFSRHHSRLLRIDMTPLVDLGFLLITFFVFTTTVSAPAAMSLNMPNDKIIKDSNNITESLALTFLLDGHDRVFYYHGRWEDALKENRIFQTNYSFRSGIGEIIRQKQKSLDAREKFNGGRNGLMLLIKPASLAVYRNLIDALDEAVINDVKKYAVTEPDKEEEKFLAEQNSVRH